MALITHYAAKTNLLNKHLFICVINNLTNFTSIFIFDKRGNGPLRLIVYSKQCYYITIRFKGN